MYTNLTVPIFIKVSIVLCLEILIPKTIHARVRSSHTLKRFGQIKYLRSGVHIGYTT